jgi:hypothetical protein
MNLWNTADTLLINPNGAGGSSVSVTFLGTPQRSGSGSASGVAAAFKGRPSLGALLAGEASGKVFSATQLLGQIGQDVAVSVPAVAVLAATAQLSHAQSGTAQTSLLVFLPVQGVAPSLTPASYTVTPIGLTTQSLPGHSATSIQSQESKQESGGGQNGLLNAGDEQDDGQPMRRAPASDSKSDLIDTLTPEAAATPADATSWKQACEVCFAQEQVAGALVESSGSELLVAGGGNSALQLAALALVLGSTWVSTSGRPGQHRAEPPVHPF